MCEADFSLLTRVWCLAELYKAHELHLPQVLASVPKGSLGLAHVVSSGTTIN